jgi:hypothetical protein
MNAGALYGWFLGVALVVARGLGPAAWVPLWIAISFQLACFAVITWTRTRSPFMTAAASLAAAAGLAIGLVGSRPCEALLVAHPVAMVTGLLLFPLLMFSEKWAHPDVWKQFRTQAEHATFRDMLLFRHIPDLRQR